MEDCAPPKNVDQPLVEEEPLFVDKQQDGDDALDDPFKEHDVCLLQSEHISIHHHYYVKLAIFVSVMMILLTGGIVYTALVGVFSPSADYRSPPETSYVAEHQRIILNSVTLDDCTMQVGFDGSEALEAERQGVVFRNTNGSPSRAFTLFQEHGYTWARIRIMVDPNGDYGLFQDLNYTLAMAREIRKQDGMRILLDFHYSHWWADPGAQWTPPRWKQGNETISLSDMKQGVYNYTKQVMQAMKDQNTVPDAVQIGNEVNNGMLWDKGRLPDNWDNFLALFNSAIAAIDRVVDERPKIVVHLSPGKHTSDNVSWLRRFFEGSDCDVIGLSYYPMWHGTFSMLKDNIDNLSRQFPTKDIWVVETGYYWSESIVCTDDCKASSLFYPQTPRGQFDFLQGLRATLLQTKCRTVFYWGSHWTSPEAWYRGMEDWKDPERRALFATDGTALMAIDGLTQPLATCNAAPVDGKSPGIITANVLGAAALIFVMASMAFVVFWYVKNKRGQDSDGQQSRTVPPVIAVPVIVEPLPTYKDQGRETPRLLAY